MKINVINIKQAYTFCIYTLNILITMKTKQQPAIRISEETKLMLDKFISSFERKLSYEEAVARLIEIESNAIKMNAIYDAIKNA